MMTLRRQLPPAFWTVRDDRYRGGDFLPGDPLARTHQGRRLSAWFHDLVREPGDSSLCAYCDGRLHETSSATIDHFFPKEKEVAPGLALDWYNVYPACNLCNTVHKRRRWSCHALRPDVNLVPHAEETSLDAFLGWFDYDDETGRILPSRERERRAQARARLTIALVGLNAGVRPEARRGAHRDLGNAKRTGDEDRIREVAKEGPYRLIALLFLRTFVDRGHVGAQR